MALTVELTSASGWVVVSPRGPVDAATAPTLRAELDGVTAHGAHVLVDLGGVSFLDSTGLGVLIGGLRRARVEGGALRVVCADPVMLELFRVTGLTEVLDLQHDLATGLAAAIPPPAPDQLLEPDARA
jgi:anti-sigma B factor antagonist